MEKATKKLDSKKSNTVNLRNPNKPEGRVRKDKKDKKPKLMPEKE